jgi:gliding motility-associated-like protein
MKYWKYLFFLFLLLIVIKFDFGHIYYSPTSHHPVSSSSDCPNINETARVVANTTCGKSTGSIIGITATGKGKLFYTWRDANQNIIKNTLDLVNVPAGSYTLEVQDAGICKTAFTEPIVIGETNGVTIDISQLKIQEAGCNNSGSITGIKVSGATIIEWHNVATGTVLSTSEDLTNLPPGEYKLYASNLSCSKESDVFIILTDTQLPSVARVQIKTRTCDLLGDSLIVTLTVRPGGPQLSYYFTSYLGHVSDGIIYPDNVSPVLRLGNIPGGTYSLYVKKTNGCGVLLGTYTLKIPAITISIDSTLIYNDKCNRHIGLIVPAYSNGLSPPPGPQTKFIWSDEHNNVIGTNQVLRNIGAGTYRLGIISNSCASEAVFTVKDDNPVQEKPIADNTTMCLPSVVGIIVKNIDTPGIYRLYTSINDTTSIAESKSGIFYQNVNQTTDFYLAHKKGECESERTRVTVTIVTSGVKIPNTFTPNNDGINDNWNITGLEKFPGADVKIFTRSGQLIFHSVNYPVPFNGTYNGSQAPPGVYYYIIDVKQPICAGKIAGSLTIIR